MFGYSPDEYVKMGKPGPDDVAEETINEIEDKIEAQEKNYDPEIVNPDSLQLNVIKNDDKESDVKNEIFENEINQVKTILSDDEKLSSAGAERK